MFSAAYFSFIDLIRGINDPEHPLTLEELNVIRLQHVDVSDSDSYVVVHFTPTIPHCSMATLIGLSIKVSLLRALPDRFKVNVGVICQCVFIETTQLCTFTCISYWYELFLLWQLDCMHAIMNVWCGLAVKSQHMPYQFALVVIPEVIRIFSLLCAFSLIWVTLDLDACLLSHGSSLFWLLEITRGILLILSSISAISSW